MLLLIVMINSAIRQSKWIMFSVFILFLIGSVFYWMQILNTKEFIIYSNHIVKRKMMLDNVKCALADAIYSNYTLWFRELIVITNQNNNLVIFYGFIKRSNMVKFYNILSQLTGEAPEKLDRKCNLHFNAAMESKGERE